MIQDINMKNKALLLFDFDGVIFFNSEKIRMVILSKLLMEYGYNISVGECEKKFSGIRTEAILTTLKIENMPIRNFIETLRAQYLEQSLLSAAMPENLCDLLESSTQNCICSSNDKDIIKKILIKLRLDHYFNDSNIFSRDDVKCAKPHPEIYQLALKNYAKDGLSPIAIEDSQSGVLAAKAAGIYTIGFTDIQNQELLNAGADRIAKTMNEALMFVNDLL